jgi:hypothetical protein
VKLRLNWTHSAYFHDGDGGNKRWAKVKPFVEHTGNFAECLQYTSGTGFKVVTELITIKTATIPRIMMENIADIDHPLMVGVGKD